jgi:hypothetical protein
VRDDELSIFTRMVKSLRDSRGDFADDVLALDFNLIYFLELSTIGESRSASVAKLLKSSYRMVI